MTATLIFLISLILTCAYVGLMYAYSQGWELQSDFVVDGGAAYEPQTKITVIVPARNEEQNIGICLASLINQDYPTNLFEIIVVDDHSDDSTAAIAAQYANSNVTCISLADQLAGAALNSYKKAAISAGVAAATGDLIVTTDADCIAAPHWLRHMGAIFGKEQSAVIVAPVQLSCDKTVVQVFQQIDFMSMQGITAAAHRLRLGNMSNGANFAFRKDVFMAVGGYNGVDHLASGDDYLLLAKVSRLPGARISYLKAKPAIITTLPQPDWSSFLQQRIRWASKSGKYDDRRLTAVLLLVYLFNLSFLVVLIAGLFSPVLLQWLVGMFVIKTFSELIFLRPVARFFDRRYVLAYLPLLQPVHILYIVLAGVLGYVGGYTWKGRKVK